MNKAKKELEEKGFHRGLIKGEEDKGLAEKHVTKAEHNLDAAIYFDRGGYSDWSASAFFYCVYHCFLAILKRFGYESRNQECTIAVIEVLKEQGIIDIDEKFIDSLKITKIEESHWSIIKAREDLQYGVEIEFQKREEFNKSIEMCKEIINRARGIIY